MSETEKKIWAIYGTFMLTLEQLAQLIDRQPEGLRRTLSGESELAMKLAPARVKIGRRVLYKASEVARFLDEA
ncbi:MULTISPECIES: hypothetical protein [Pseudomonas]|uniref:hypothetical protein n=1 Tax=Pseudomonas TaxID=286 RepID=UPI0008F33799|nr:MULTISPECIES: hypothetical protein [Pseudomonas]SFU17886.1 hypothetical protein SAMN05216264_11851 [Pseudomonas marincola]